MKNLILFALTLLLFSCGILMEKQETNNETTQEAVIDNNYKEIEGEAVYRTVGKIPEYPGGNSKMWKDLNEKIKCLDSKKGFFHSSKILTRFVIEKDGSISNAIAFGPMKESCEKEVINALKAMPKWTPGKHENKIVRVSRALLIFVD